MSCCRSGADALIAADLGDVGGEGLLRLEVQVAFDLQSIRRELLPNVVYGLESSGDLVGLLNLFSVHELHSHNDFRQ